MSCQSQTPSSEGQGLLCNAAAGVIAATFVCPLDVIKTRFQVHGLAGRLPKFPKEGKKNGYSKIWKASSQEHWEEFVKHNLRPDFIKKRKQDAENRKGLKIYHRTGRHGFARTEHLMELLKEAVETQPNDFCEDLLDDPLTQVFGIDDRGRVRAVGSSVSRTQIQDALPAISKMKKKAIEQDAKSEKSGQEWESYKGDLNQTVEEIRVMCQTILKNQNNAIPARPSSATEQHNMAMRTERKCNLTNWRRTVVAKGRVVEGEKQMKMHGVPLSEDDHRVTLDAIYEPETPLRMSNSFAGTFGDVTVGGHSLA